MVWGLRFRIAFWGCRVEGSGIWGIGLSGWVFPTIGGTLSGGFR